MSSYNGKLDYLYNFGVKVFNFLAIKCRIAQNLYPAYQAKDKETLKDISENLLPKLKDATVTLHQTHRDMWFNSYKTIGWSGLDLRYGGMINCCDTAKLILDDYLSGKTDFIEELEEKRFHKDVTGFSKYRYITYPVSNIKD